MDLIIMLSIAVGLTAFLIAREVRRNRRARSVLVGDGYEVDLSPPWFVRKQSDAKSSSPDKPIQQGVWSAWFRDGKLGAYVCTYVSVTAQATRHPIPILGARFEIVDNPDSDRVVLAGEEITIPGSDGSAGVPRLEIDASISVNSPPPGKSAMLVLLLNLDGKHVERRLCPVEHKFAAAGASLKELERV